MQLYFLKWPSTDSDKFYLPFAAVRISVTETFREEETVNISYYFSLTAWRLTGVVLKFGPGT